MKMDFGATRNAESQNITKWTYGFVLEDSNTCSDNSYGDKISIRYYEDMVF